MVCRTAARAGIDQPAQLILRKRLKQSQRLMSLWPGQSGCTLC